MHPHIASWLGTVLVVVMICGGGCQNTPSSSSAGNHATASPTGGKPSWIYKPSPGSGQFGGVGSARRHVEGVPAQRQLAISRAIDEIARQMGVSVRNFVRTETRLEGEAVQSAMDLYSIQTTDNKTVRAQIRAFWEDAEAGDLYVWMTTL